MVWEGGREGGRRWVRGDLNEGTVVTVFWLSVNQSRSEYGIWTDCDRIPDQQRESSKYFFPA